MLDGFICQTVEKENKIFTTTIEAGNFMIIPPNHYHQVTEASDSGTRFSVAFQIESQDTYILAAIEQIKKILVFPFPEAASSLPVTFAWIAFAIVDFPVPLMAYLIFSLRGSISIELHPIC